MTILENVKEILKSIDGTIDTAAITVSSRLVEDLEIDSLSAAMIAVEIENKYGIEAADNIKFITIGDICDYIEGNRA